MSSHTIRAYTVDLEHWLEYLNKSSQINNLIQLDSDLKPSHLRTYLAALFDTHERSSLSRRLSAIRTFLRYLRNEGRIKKDIGKLVPTPKSSKPLPRFLKIEDILELLKSPDCSKFLGKRDRALIEILYGCGLRVSEVVGLNLRDVDFAGGWLRVMGKGSKERFVPLGKPAKIALEVYLNALKDSSMNSPLIVNYKGSRLSTRSVARILTRNLMRKFQLDRLWLLIVRFFQK